MKIYIRSSACISAQNTFGTDGFLTDVVPYHGTRLKTIEPDYKEFIDPKLLRRMSHVLKMGVAAAMQCLKQGDTEMPGAIITGTAYGCMDDTVAFLSRIIEQNEELLSPTAFIQSTHNTVASQIALMLKCHNYNTTFVHKGASFENALLDAVLLLKENEADNVLVGGIDEMNDAAFAILSRLGLYKRWPVSNLDLYATKTRGSMGGEGTAFFLLTDRASANNLAELKGVKTIYKPASSEDFEKRVVSFLAQNSLSIDDIDLVITGRSGDTWHDEAYKQINQSLFKHTGLANYKHLSGEYPTSTAFALWLASNIIKNKAVPETVIERRGKEMAPKTILIYNHYQKKYHSLILVSAI
ncbi:MAG: beta-ketoacyl synthase chain length factor [Sphingobacteriales bacterium]